MMLNWVNVYIVHKLNAILLIFCCCYSYAAAAAVLRFLCRSEFSLQRPIRYQVYANTMNVCTWLLLRMVFSLMSFIHTSIHIYLCEAQSYFSAYEFFLSLQIIFVLPWALINLTRCSCMRVCVRCTLLARFEFGVAIVNSWCQTGGKV